MENVEKFKEKLEKLKYSSFAGINIKPTIELEEELMHMYEELEEPQEKPFIKVNDYFIEFNTIIATTLSNKIMKYTTNKLEEKENMLITDDFIFIKEELWKEK